MLATWPPGRRWSSSNRGCSSPLGSWDVRGDIDVLRLAREASGALQILIADIKSSTAAKVEHRLQVAFYSEMVGALLAEAGIAVDRIGPGDPLPRDRPTTRVRRRRASAERRERERERARDLLGVEDGLLELVDDAEAYRGSVRDLVTGEHSTARRVVDAPFEAIPFHLTYKCDGCLYNEFCMKWSAETDDLSLLPHLTGTEKEALQRNGIATTRGSGRAQGLREAIPVDGASRSGPSWSRRRDRRRRSRRLGRHLAGRAPARRADPPRPELPRACEGRRRDALSYIPEQGLQHAARCDADQNPNLVRVYIDAQHDYLHDRIYLLGALVVASEGGVETRSGGGASCA